MGLGFHSVGPNEPAKTSKIVEGFGSLGTAEPIFDFWESSDTLGITRNGRKIGGKTEVNSFRVISEENLVDFINSRGHTGHIETLWGVEFADAPREGSAVFDK